MRIANSVLGLPYDYRCYEIDDKGAYSETRIVRNKKTQKYPRCRKGNAVVHGHVKRSVYHAPMRPKPCMLVIDLRCYCCRKCGKAFFEPMSIISSTTPHATVGLGAPTIGQMRLGYSFAEITHSYDASADMIQKAIDAAPLPKRHLPRHLCVNEFHAFSRRGVHLCDTRQYWTASVDSSSDRFVDVIRRCGRQAIKA